MVVVVVVVASVEVVELVEVVVSVVTHAVSSIKTHVAPKLKGDKAHPHSQGFSSKFILVC